MRTSAAAFKVCLPKDLISPFLLRKHYDSSKQDKGFTGTAYFAFVSEHESCV